VPPAVTAVATHQLRVVGVAVTLLTLANVLAYAAGLHRGWVVFALDSLFNLVLLWEVSTLCLRAYRGSARAADAELMVYLVVLKLAPAWTPLNVALMFIPAPPFVRRHLLLLRTTR
jgi:hypothetical protein